MSWNASQRSMLEAMGYVLDRFAIGAPAAPATSAPARASTAGSSSAGADAGVPLPPLALLRGDATAKRALWPRLRALRRS